MNGYPKRILILDEIINKIKDINKNFYNSSSLRSEPAIDELLSEIKIIIRMSSEISAEVYNYAKDIEAAITSHFNVVKTFGFITYEEPNPQSKITTETKGRLWSLNLETNAEIGKIHERFYEYHDKLSSNYNKLMKLN